MRKAANERVSGRTRPPRLHSFFLRVAVPRTRALRSAHARSTTSYMSTPPPATAGRTLLVPVEDTVVRETAQRHIRFFVLSPRLTRSQPDTHAPSLQACVATLKWTLDQIYREGKIKKRSGEKPTRARTSQPRPSFPSHSASLSLSPSHARPRRHRPLPVHYPGPAPRPRRVHVWRAVRAARTRSGAAPGRRTRGLDCALHPSSRRGGRALSRRHRVLP